MSGTVRRRRKAGQSKTVDQMAVDKALFAEALAEIDEMSEEQLGGYRDIFKIVDVDDGGTIDADELFKAMNMNNEGGVSREEVDELVQVADADGSGEVDLKEFAALMLFSSKQNKRESSLSEEEISNLEQYGLNREQLNKLHERFNALDKDGNGEISMEEFEDHTEIKENPMLKRVIDIFDADGDETVSFVEFARALAIFSQDNEEEKLKFMFRVYDMDKDGWISNQDLYHTLCVTVSDNNTPEQLQMVADRTMAEVDTNGDGLIGWEEFKVACEKQHFGDKLALAI